MLVQRLVTNANSARLLLRKPPSVFNSVVLSSLNRNFSTSFSSFANDDAFIGSLDFDSILTNKKATTATATTTVVSAVMPSESPHMDEFGRVYGTGKRKRSIARVWIKEGSGELIVNNKSFVDYFQSPQRAHTLEPFNASRTAAMFDVWCTVKGGGMSGQAGAVQLGISRALDKYNSLLRPSLRAGGYLTRDPRKVERKKAGQHKARRKYQWVKR